jgi:hypothetical protein
MESKVRKVSKAEARRAVKAHEKAMHGKDTKKMKAGGPTSLDMKKYGRGMAKVMNQRQSVRGR